ncbi:MAG: BrnT family toxin [bacterium]|nr:BrnT family toxin [bacterium]
MKFEYDTVKSVANRSKHGIDFDEAQALWDDPCVIEAPANVTEEQRFLAVGMIGARHWTAVYTYRNERVRIISVRRSRKQEIEHYEGE